MNKEQINKYEQLKIERHEAEKRLSWFVDWEQTLYDGEVAENERFYITITRWNSGKVVLQRDTTREVAEQEFHAERIRLEAELERIDKEIEKI